MRPIIALMLLVLGSTTVGAGEPNFAAAKAACDKLQSGQTDCNRYLDIARIERPKLLAVLKRQETARAEGVYSKDIEDEVYNRKSVWRLALNGLIPYAAWYYVWPGRPYL